MWTVRPEFLFLTLDAHSLHISLRYTCSLVSTIAQLRRPLLKIGVQCASMNLHALSAIGHKLRTVRFESGLADIHEYEVELEGDETAFRGHVEAKLATSSLFRSCDVQSLVLTLEMGHQLPSFLASESVRVSAIHCLPTELVTVTGWSNLQFAPRVAGSWRKVFRGRAANSAFQALVAVAEEEASSSRLLLPFRDPSRTEIVEFEVRGIGAFEVLVGPEQKEDTLAVLRWLIPKVQPVPCRSIVVCDEIPGSIFNAAVSSHDRQCLILSRRHLQRLPKQRLNESLEELDLIWSCCTVMTVSKEAAAVALQKMMENCVTSAGLSAKGIKLCVQILQWHNQACSRAEGSSIVAFIALCRREALSVALRLCLSQVSVFGSVLLSMNPSLQRPVAPPFRSLNVAITSTEALVLRTNKSRLNASALVEDRTLHITTAVAGEPIDTEISICIAVLVAENVQNGAAKKTAVIETHPNKSEREFVTASTFFGAESTWFESTVPSVAAAEKPFVPPVVEQYTVDFALFLFPQKLKCRGGATISTSFRFSEAMLEHARESEEQKRTVRVTWQSEALAPSSLHNSPCQFAILADAVGEWIGCGVEVFTHQGGLAPEIITALNRHLFTEPSLCCAREFVNHLRNDDRRCEDDASLIFEATLEE